MGEEAAREHPFSANLPDFGRASALLRSAVAAQALLLVHVFEGSAGNGEGWGALLARLAKTAAFFEPALIASLALMSILIPRLGEKSRLWAVAGIAALAGAGVCAVLRALGMGNSNPLEGAVNGLLCAFALALYFDWRHRRLSPALSEARLTALQSKIRPHFFFNAINAIVLLIQKKPDEAEERLLDLADVMRFLIKNKSEWISVKEEIDIVKKYLAIEKSRFGERLTVNWRVDSAALEGRVPALILQPLAENALIHGIELCGSGIIEISVIANEGKLILSVENPLPTSDGGQSFREHNGIAMENIRQRLELLYEAEGQLRAGPRDGGVWRSVVTMPLVKKSQSEKKP